VTDTYSTAGPLCPYCGHQHRADDPFYYDEGVTQMECEHCDLKFDVRIYTQTSWSCDKREAT
jgi:hypothetical protein